MTRFSIVGLVLAVCMLNLSGLPAQAHSPSEIEEYEDEWLRQVRTNGGLSIELLEEWRDWMDRHPHYYGTDEDRSYGAQASDSTYVSARQDWGPAVEQWRPLVAGHFAPSKVETALCLMWHESRGNPDAKNPSSSASGLFQLLAMWHDHFGIDPFVPEQNVWAAAQLQSLYGWSQWAPYNRGECR